MDTQRAEIGILTFHCSNNYGAMLQAYGLKTFLRQNGRAADIVRYEPFFMTGRHWWFPYVPMNGWIWRAYNMLAGFRSNWRRRRDFSQQLRNMDDFRCRRLVDKSAGKIRTLAGLRKLEYPYYVVGSDQIWNPDITCGLRRAYFGDFPNKHKKKTVSYAASIGGAELPPRYDGEFSRLVRRLDAVSVREEASIPYVERLYGAPVSAVLDPVFLLDQAAWREVEQVPDRARGGGYILLYVTQPDEAMSAYAKALSQEKGLPVIEVCADRYGIDAAFQVDGTAGPAQLLGYIHRADYVVSNSFHAAAFSIIYEKRFLAFLHSTRGERVRNIIGLFGLENRLCQGGRTADIDADTDWNAVRERVRAGARESGQFLLRRLPG